MGAALAALLAAGAVGACGGGHHKAPRNDVAGAIRGYFEAVGGHRAGDTCASFTEQSRERLAEFGHEQLQIAHPSCARTLEAFYASSAARSLTAGGHRIYRITIAGNHATARVQGVGHPLKLDLVGGRWLIDSAPTGETD
jgi:hypothetical protein